MAEGKSTENYRASIALEPVREMAVLAARVLKGFKLNVVGKENVQGVSRKNPVVFTYGPHCGHPDAFTVRAALPLRLRWLYVALAARDYWADNKLRYLGSQLAMNTAPITRGGDRTELHKGVEEMKALLESGYSISVAPEGTRSNKPFGTQPFKTGWAEAVAQYRCPVIPVTLLGLENLWPKGQPLGRLDEPATVIFGKPLTFENGENRKEITATVREVMLSTYYSMREETIPTE